MSDTNLTNPSKLDSCRRVDDYFVGRKVIVEGRTEIHDATGEYKMESRQGVVAYFGHGGRAGCLAVPQCKFMNSTVLDQYAKHTVYVGKSKCVSNERLVSLGISGMSNSKRNSKERIEWEKEQPFEIRGTHLPFDLWCLIGAVFGKALTVWRSVEHMDIERMPEWMLVTYREIFETLNPGSEWKDLSVKSKYYWRSHLTKAFEVLNETSLMYDLPDGVDGERNAYVMRSVLESTWVRRRAATPCEERRCMREWGEPWDPFGIKVRLSGHPLFDFCWRHGDGIPALVQIHRKDYNCKKILGTLRGWSKCFPVTFGAWLVLYRNYWKRRGGFKTCDLSWRMSEMAHAFDGMVFDVAKLTTCEMEKVMNWFCSPGAHRSVRISGYTVVRRGEISWEMLKTALSDSVVVKDADGKNTTLSRSGIVEIPKDVADAAMQMQGINLENSRHRVTLDGKRIETHESVIYRTLFKDGKWTLDDERNGRCYSMANGIQGLRRADRRRVLIDGRKTVEVDYESLHPNMLYALNGLEYDGGGMYDVGKRWHFGSLDASEARKAVKMMLLRMINAKTQSNAVHSFKKAWNEAHGRDAKEFIPWLFSLYDAISRRHGGISHEFCTGKGVYLMNLDGRLIRNVCSRLASDGICALGIHDSVVVRKDHAWKARRIMMEEFAKMFAGWSIAVTFKE